MFSQTKKVLNFINTLKHIFN